LFHDDTYNNDTGTKTTEGVNQSNIFSLEMEIDNLTFNQKISSLPLDTGLL